MTNIKSGILARFHAPITKLALSLCAIGIASVAKAADYAWTGGGGADTNFSTPANWDSESAYPGTDDGAMFTEDAASKTVTFDGEYSPDWVWVATGDVLTPVTWEAATSADGMTVAGNIGVADNNGTQTGALSISSGTYSAAKVVVGNTFGNNGLLTMTGGSLSATNVMDFANGEGSIVLDGGNLTIAKGMTWCWSEAGAGHASLSISNGGKLTVSGSFDNTTTALNAMWGGPGHKIDINVANGTFEAPQGDLYFGTYGSWADAYPNGNVTGYVKIDIGEGGVFSCGSAMTARTLMLGQFGSEPMTVNVNGGTLAVGRITRGGDGAANVNVNGGTLAVNGTYEDGVFLTDSDIVYTVGSNGATLNTNGKEITIAATIGGTGTLNIVGGGKVTFSAEPACTVSSSDDTPFVRPSDTAVEGLVAYYWIGESGAEWNNGNNWSISRGGPAAGDYPKNVETDCAFILAETSVAVSDTASVNTLKVGGKVTFVGGGTIYTRNTSNVGIAGKMILSNINLGQDAGVTINLSSPIDIPSHSTVNFVGCDKGNSSPSWVFFDITGAVTGGGTIIAKEYARPQGIRFLGDCSGFYGEYVSEASNNVARYADRDGFYMQSGASSSARAKWYVFGYGAQDRRVFGTDNETYYFGALNGRVYLIANKSGQNDRWMKNICFEVGALNEDCSFGGQMNYSAATSWGNWIRKVGSAKLTYTGSSLYGVEIQGGTFAYGSVNSATDVSFMRFAGEGGYLGLTADDTVNSAAFSCLTEVGETSLFGFDYSEESEITLDASSKASILAGKKIAKKGGGKLNLVGLPAGVDVVVNEGVLVLPVGFVADEVDCGAASGELQIDVGAATDGTKVFECKSLVGELTFANKPTIANITSDTTVEGTTVWTISFTGADRTFTWNGLEGSSWDDAVNWLVDGETAQEVPSAADTAYFAASAKVSASGAIAAKVVELADDVTLTIPIGLTFNSIKFGDNAKIAFDYTPFAAVGDSASFITVVSQDSFSIGAIELPPSSVYEWSLTDGVLSVKRNAATYTWTGAVDEYWGTWGNWSVNDASVREKPVAGDTVLFPQLGEGDPENWTVVLGGEQAVDTVTFLGATKLVGNYLACTTVSGTGKIILGDDAGIKYSNSDDIANEIKVAGTEGHTCKLFADGVRFAVTGSLAGDGHLELVARDDQNGIILKGENKMTGGSITVRNALYSPSRNCSGIEKAASSSNVVWQITNGAAGNNQTQFSWFRDNGDGEYYFGALGAGYMAQPGNFENATLVIGALGQTDTLSGCLACYATKSGVVTTDRRWDTEYNSVTVKKVGDGTLKVNAQSIHNYEIASGILELLDDDAHAKPETGYISFTGDGMLKLNDAFTIDVSTNIANGVSTGPVAVDVGTVPREWAAKIPSACSGGLIKDGSGTLTLSAAPEYTGATWVKDGKLVVPATVPEVELTLDPRTAANAVENAHVAGWAYIANTVVYANDSDDDNMTVDIDASGIAKIDISDPSFVDMLRYQKRVVICGTTGTIAGFNPKKFVLGENLLVPEKPEGVADGKWDWTVKLMQINGKNCICVVLRTQPFFIRLR